MKNSQRRRSYRQIVCVKKIRRKGITSIEYCADASIQRHKDCIKKSKERLIVATGNIINDIGSNRTENLKKKLSENKLYIYIHTYVYIYIYILSDKLMK